MGTIISAATKTTGARKVSPTALRWRTAATAAPNRPKTRAW